MIQRYALVKVIRTLIESSKPLSIRQVAKEANTSVSRAKYCLDWLFGKEIISKKIVGRSHQYKLDLKNTLTRHIKILYSLSLLQESNILDELKSYPISSIILYGSIARGEDDTKSDIDLLIIARKKFKIPLIKAEKKLGREVTYIIYTLPEWRRKAKEDKVFYDRVIIDGIALYGEMPVVS